MMAESVATTAEPDNLQRLGVVGVVAFHLLAATFGARRANNFPAPYANLESRTCALFLTVPVVVPSSPARSAHIGVAAGPARPADVRRNDRAACERAIPE